MIVKEVNEFSSLRNTELCITINGNTAKNEKEFLTQIYDKLFFSDPDYMNWDAYIDWMKDLSWITEKEIVILVYNWDSFLKDAKRITKELFVADYEDAIFPYWAKEKQYEPPNPFLKTLNVAYTFSDEIELLKYMDLIKTNAAIYYAKGYMNRMYKVDVIAGFESNDKWVFTGGFKDSTSYGNPQIVLTKKSGIIEPLNVKISELLKMSKESKKINL